MNESTATRYQRVRRRAQVAVRLIGALWLLVLVVSPVGVAMAAWASTTFWPVAVYAAAVSLVWELVAVPAAWLAIGRAGAKLKRGEPPAPLVRDLGRDAIIGIGLTMAVAVCVTTAIRLTPHAWWLVVGVLSVPGFLLAAATTALVLRSDATSREISRPELARLLGDLSERTVGRRVAVREWGPAVDGPVALVTGVGPTGTVLLSRVLAQEWRPEEVAVVVAHELAHHVRRDLWRTALLDGAMLTAACWGADWVIRQWGSALGVRALTDLTALPVLALAAGGVWWGLRPIRLVQSRAHERAADQLALEWTRAPEAFGAAVRRLSARQLSEERPSTLTRWFFHRHPTAEERLNAARRAWPKR